MKIAQHKYQKENLNETYREELEQVTSIYQEALKQSEYKRLEQDTLRRSFDDILLQEVDMLSSRRRTEERRRI